MFCILLVGKVCAMSYLVSVCILFISSYVKKLMQTSITEELVQKVASQRLFSLTVHPTADKIIVCAGDKWGRLGLWDVVRICCRCWLFTGLPKTVIFL